MSTQAAFERAVIESYRADVIERQKFCSVTGHKLNHANAVHLVLPSGVPTGFVFTPEGAELVKSGEVTLSVVLERDWRFE